MKNWEWKLCDHKWNNLKRWVEAFTEGKGKDAVMKVSSLKKMFEAVDEMQKATDDSIEEAVFGKEK